MDNLTHTLTGLVLARAGAVQGSRRATAALVIGSNLPDADSIAGFYGNLYYLEHHRGITHSLPGLCLLSLLLAGLLGARTRRRAPGASPVRPLRLLVLSWLAQAIHLAMDYLNSYGVRPFLPWEGRWFYGDLAFIVDPWMWLLLGAALFVSWPGLRMLGLGWIFLGVSTGFLVLAGALDSELAVPWSVPALWIGGACLAVLLRSRLLAPVRFPAGRFSFRRLSEPALACRLALVALVLYGLLLAVSHQGALARIARESGELLGGARARSIAALPVPANPFRWVGIVEAPELLFIKTGAAWIRLPRRLDEPAVRSVRAHCAGAALFRFYRFPVADVEPSGAGFEVVLRDARYRREGRSGFGAAALALGSDLSVIAESRCPPPAAWAHRRSSSFSYCFGPGPDGRIPP